MNLEKIISQKPYNKEVLKFKSDLRVFADAIIEYKNIHNCTLNDSYNYVEGQYERLFGERRFKSYISFKNSANFNHNIKL